MQRYHGRQHAGRARISHTTITYHVQLYVVREGTVEEMEGQYPSTRLRRNRRDAWSRALVRQAGLTPSDLIWPMFVQEEAAAADPATGHTPVPSMPGVNRVTVAALLEQVAEAVALRIPAVALFPQTAEDAKSEGAEEAYNPESLVNRAVRAIRARFSSDQIGIVCDVALDPYSLSGHDGLIDGDKIPCFGPSRATPRLISSLVPAAEGLVMNDETVGVLVKQVRERQGGRGRKESRAGCPGGRQRAERSACAGRFACAGWLRHHCTLRYDGWPRRCHPQCSGCSRPTPRPHHGLLGSAPIRPIARLPVPFSISCYTQRPFCAGEVLFSILRAFP